MEGFILIDKPKGITSFDVIRKLRQITGIKKIGHCGTLDPNATGLLICAISRSATRDIESFLKKDKTYLAEIELGKISDTFDAEGVIKKTMVKKKPSLKEIKEALNFFTGEISQVPPIYSAKKIKGKKAYELAREGKVFSLKPVKIKIKSIKIISYNFPILKIKIDCSSGTYIRSLTFDIGEKLETGAYLKNLRRTKIDFFSVEDALFLEKINLKKIEKKLFQIKK